MVAGVKLISAWVNIKFLQFAWVWMIVIMIILVILQNIEGVLPLIMSTESVKIVTDVTNVSLWIQQLNVIQKKLSLAFNFCTFSLIITFYQLLMTHHAMTHQRYEFESLNKYNVYYDSIDKKFKCSPNQSSCAENVCQCDTEFVNSWVTILYRLGSRNENDTATLNNNKSRFQFLNTTYRWSNICRW